MNRITVALLAAFDAAVTALIGVGIALVPLTVLWAVQYDTGVDWMIFWRAAADVWLLGNGADLTATLDPTVATAIGVPGADQPFAVTIAPLGFALLAALLGVRIGRRAAATPFRLAAVGTAIVTYAVIAALVTLGSADPAARVELWQGILWPTVVFAVGIAIGSGIASARAVDVAGVSRSIDQGATVPVARTARGQASSAARGAATGRGGAPSVSTLAEADPVARLVASLAARLPAHLRAVIGASVTGGAVAAAGLLGAAAVIVAVLLFAGYASAVQLFEALQGGVLGTVAVTIAQLAFLPNLVVWAGSWLVGPGFAIGAGSSVTPAGTQLGPVPGLPVFAALPQGELAFGFLGLAVPLLAGFAAAVIVRRRLFAGLGPAAPVLWAAVASIGIGLVGGLLLGLLAWFSGGAAGPGRLATVGPEPLLVGAIAAAEFAVAAAVGFASTPRR